MRKDLRDVAVGAEAAFLERFREDFAASGTTRAYSRSRSEDARAVAELTRGAGASRPRKTLHRLGGSSASLRGSTGSISTRRSTTTSLWAFETPEAVRRNDGSCPSGRPIGAFFRE